MTAANQKPHHYASTRFAALAAASACLVVAGLAAPTAAAVASGGRAASATAGPDAWEQARRITSPDGLTISITGISCTAPGDCAAAGTAEEILGYYEPPSYEGFVIDERDGIWGGVEPLPGLLALNVGGTATITAPSCASAGNCGVGGTYEDGNGDYHAYVASERNGTWLKAQPIPGLAALATEGNDSISQVSCGAPGDCTATGTYYAGAEPDTVEKPFHVTEKNGTWGRAAQAPSYWIDQASGGLACAGPGDCALVGYFNPEGPFVVEEKNGAWGTATVLSGGQYTTVDSVTCPSPGNCLAGGDDYGTATDDTNEAGVWRESDGTWSAVAPLPGMVALGATQSGVTLLSCASPTSCAAAGWYDNANGYEVPFVAHETDGTWAAPVSLAGLAGIAINSNSVNLVVTSLSCGASGDCTVGGYYAKTDPNQGWAFLADEAGGTWSKVKRVPGVPAGSGLVVGSYSYVPPIDSMVAQVSCTAGGFCGAAGADVETYHGKAYQAGFLVNKAVATPTTTALRLSAGRVTYGREQSEKLTVTVAPRKKTLAGTVTVKAGSVTVCAIVLKSTAGICTLAAKRLGPGTYHLTARYTGSALYRGSVSAAKQLTIGK